jgi:hypothetical protein
VIVHGVVPDPVVEVLLDVPVQPVNCVPDAAALPRALVTAVKSVFTAANTAITLPATGAVLAVIVVP